MVPNSICGVLQSVLDQSPAATRSQTSPPKCSYFMLFHAKHNGLPPRGHLMLGSILVTIPDSGCPRNRLQEGTSSVDELPGIINVAGRLSEPANVRTCLEESMDHSLMICHDFPSQLSSYSGNRGDAAN